MDHAISIDESATMTTPNERLEALKAKYVPTPNNQQQVGDGDLQKIMDHALYKATIDGDADKFIDALEALSESRKLALSLIFDQVTPSGNSLLHVAASSGKDDVMELILIHFPYLVTRKNSSDDTPLHVAVQKRTVKAVEMLIRLRRDSDIIYWKNKDSKSPLYLAVDNCKSSDWRDRKGASWEILQLLLEASARDEEYAVKIQGMSPVLAAFEEREWESDMLKEIIDRLPKLLHVRGEDGGTPLHSAASVGNARAVDLLLQKCPDLALQTDNNGSYPIHIACEGRAVLELPELIKDTWPNLAEIKNNNGQNILHVAAKAGNTVAVSIISRNCKEADIKKMANSKDVNGNTPLHLASMHNHCPIMLYLTRDQRSDLELLNNDKLTALDVALKSKSLSTKNPVALGRAILITAGVPQSKGPGDLSPGEHAQWMKDQVNTRLLVATLVATVTFAAGFTLPGGYNASSDPHPGTATMLHDRMFQVFIIADMLAMYSSILAVTVLLWGHNDFYTAKQVYLIAGPLLFMSLTGMSVAFFASIMVSMSELSWLTILVLYAALVFLFLLIRLSAAFIFPFSKTAMRVVSLCYMLEALPGYVVWRLRSKYLHDQSQPPVYFF